MQSLSDQFVFFSRPENMPWFIALAVFIFIAVVFFWNRKRRTLKPKVSEVRPEGKPGVAAPTTPSLQQALGNTRGQLFGLWTRWRSKPADATLIEELEETLIGADFGLKTTQQMLQGLDVKTQPEQMRRVLHEECLRILPSTEPGDALWTRVRSHSKPFVIMMVGVNGVGKTTTIGKLAAQAYKQNLKVLMGAGDTFRAAASEQLGVWATRARAELISRGEGGDPASVLFDTLNAAKARGHDLVLLDTAGRLHSKQALLDELQKCVRVMKKVIPDAPHETWLVVDATTGQNAVRQAAEFHSCVSLTGIILTKLDGTAKGGVVVAIARELGLPVRFVGIGEGVDDLISFDKEAFTQAILPLDPPL